MSDQRVRIAERLKSECQRMLEFFRAIPKGEFDRVIYEEGSRWTIRQILAHFVSAEVGFQELIRDILAGRSGSPEGFDINAYNEKQVTYFTGVSIELLFEQFTQYREENIALVEQMGEADLWRVGRHPYLGEATLEEIVKLIYRHNQIHQREIRRALD